MLPARCVTCLCDEGGERCKMADMGMCGLPPVAAEGELADNRLAVGVEEEGGGLFGVTGAGLPF